MPAPARGMAPTPGRWHADALLERVLVFILAASLGGLGLALAGAFQAWAVWLFAIIATAAYHWRAAPTPASPLGLRLVPLLAVLALALLFRLPTYQYVLGGQDPGVYANMATHVMRTGGIAVGDHAFDRLAGTDGFAEYRRLNVVDPFVPGVYTGEGEKPSLSFQFYHLFPVWLALAASVAGVGASGLGLLVLSLLSIVCFQRLAAELSGTRHIGLAAGLLLAANPLHAFFSKFPVTEVPTLAFSTAAFCFLSMYAQAPREHRPSRWLWLSVLAMGCLFLTRISGFMYLPLVLAVSVVALACDADRVRARMLSAWSLLVVLAYLGSVAYGLAWSRRYALDIHEDVFAPLLGPNWRLALAILGLAVAATWAAAWAARDRPAMAALARAISRLDRLIGPALLLLLPLAAYKAWQLGFTRHYQGHEVLGQFPGLVQAGWDSVARTNLVVTAMHLGPPAFIALFALAQARLPARGRLLLFFVSAFTAYAALLNWVAPYQPYYARYVLSELVPYALLLLCCALAWLPTPAARRWLGAALVASAAWYLALSGLQIGKRDNDGAMATIGELAARIGDDDVILLDGARIDGFEPAQLKTTLLYTFGRHVITLDPSSLADLGFMTAVDEADARGYGLSTRPGSPRGYTELEPARIRAMGFERSSWPPHRLVPMLDVRLRVLRLDRLDFLPGSTRTVALGRDAPAPLALPPGRYRLVLRGDADGRHDARLRVVALGQDGALAEAAINPEETPGGALGWLEFEVAHATLGHVAIKVQAGEGSRLKLRDYSLTRIR